MPKWAPGLVICILAGRKQAHYQWFDISSADKAFLMPSQTLTGYFIYRASLLTINIWEHSEG
jgi:hypothetical protein